MVSAKANGIKCQISASELDTINKRPSNTEVRDIEINQVDDRNVNGYYCIIVEVSKVKKSIIITCKLKS